MNSLINNNMAKTIAQFKATDFQTEEEVLANEIKFKKDRVVNEIKLEFIKSIKTKKDYENFKLFFERKDKSIEESNIQLNLYRSSLGEMAIKARIKEEALTENPITRMITLCFGSCMKIDRADEKSEFSQKNPDELLEEVKAWVADGNDIKEFGCFSDYMLIELFDKVHYHFSLYDTIEGKEDKYDNKNTSVVVNPNFCDYKKVKYDSIQEGISSSRQQVNYFK
jgi:hypothetical protein